MSNRDYDYFLDFLLLLHQNNGIVDNELVNNYILTDTENKEQLRKAEEVKRAESADRKREIQLKEETMRLKEEAMRLKEETMRLKEEERRIQEKERRIQEDERRKQEEEERRIQEKERRKQEKEARRIQEEENRRLEQIQDLINKTANVLELHPTIPLAQFVDCGQLDLITDKHSVDSYGYGYTSYGYIHYSV
jgi:hypothetical protein